MMLQYIIRRIITSIPVLIGILFVTFSLARLIPGDPCRAILGEKATEKICERFIQEKGLDKPILTQFGRDCARRFRHIFTPFKAGG
jgi:peptide/nickel transport system permease protein